MRAKLVSRGALYGNVLNHRRQCFLSGPYQRGCIYGGNSRPYPEGCNTNTMYQDIAIKLARVIIKVFEGKPLSVPPRGVSLPSVLRLGQVNLGTCTFGMRNGSQPDPRTRGFGGICVKGIPIDSMLLLRFVDVGGVPAIV